MPTRPPAARRWEPIVRHARRSGLSIRAYARENGINERTLTWWNWKLGAETANATFVEVTVTSARSPLRLHVGAAHVDLDEQTDLNLLRRVVDALS